MTGHRRESERGAVLEEFALAGLVALFLIFGVFEFGRALFTYDLVANSARIGTRYAMVRGSLCTLSGCPATQTSVSTYVKSVSPGIDSNQLTVSTKWTATPACPTTPGAGCVVTVSVSYPFSFDVFQYLLASFTITSQSQMTISQ